MLVEKALKKVAKILFGVSLVFFVTGCSTHRLYGRLERVSSGTSVHEILLTPTPGDWTESSGQRLVVSWLLPRSKFSIDQLTLHADIVFSKGQRDLIEVDSITRWNHWIYEHSNEKIDQRGPIVTYKIWITDKEEILQSFQHKLYREWIDPDVLQEEVLQEEVSF